MKFEVRHGFVHTATVAEVLFCTVTQAKRHTQTMKLSEELNQPLGLAALSLTCL